MSSSLHNDKSSPSDGEPNRGTYRIGIFDYSGRKNTDPDASAVAWFAVCSHAASEKRSRIHLLKEEPGVSKSAFAKIRRIEAASLWPDAGDR
ncbi:hypothetical protein [Rhizobium sp. G21]|uniref:hypothetical protein n=1 Tax=Rhizobium sp. G21 TaxID=2758439 RepID=UPI001603B9DF|nr:hypothetical protein [Rhizobium sp. G21]MBB1251560.1 hypothetical protein [Rhizobium sp. G21]